MTESSDTQSAHVSDTLDFAYRSRKVPETMAPVEINTEYGEMTTMEVSYREYLAIMERKPEPPEILILPFETSFESNGARVGGFSVRTDSKRGKMSSVHWEWTDAEILGGWVEFEQWPGGSQRGETSKNICAHYIIDAETGYGFQSTDDGLRKIRLRSNERVSDIQPITSLPFDVVPLKLPESHVFSLRQIRTKRRITPMESGTWFPARNKRSGIGMMLGLCGAMVNGHARTVPINNL